MHNGGVYSHMANYDLVVAAILPGLHSPSRVNVPKVEFSLESVVSRMRVFGILPVTLAEQLMDVNNNNNRVQWRAGENPQRKCK